MTIPANDREKNRIRQIAGLLYQASRSIRVLDSVDWPPEVKAEFFAKGAQELPQVSYQPLDLTPAIEAVVEARRAIVPVTTVDLWLDRQADTLLSVPVRSSTTVARSTAGPLALIACSPSLPRNSPSVSAIPSNSLPASRWTSPRPSTTTPRK
jgi:hypothetical protein